MTQNLTLSAVLLALVPLAGHAQAPFAATNRTGSALASHPAEPQEAIATGDRKVDADGSVPATSRTDRVAAGTPARDSNVIRRQTYGLLDTAAAASVICDQGGIGVAQVNGIAPGPAGYSAYSSLDMVGQYIAACGSGRFTPAIAGATVAPNRVTFATPLPAAQVASLRPGMWVTTNNASPGPKYSVWETQIATIDPAGRFVTVTGWAAGGGGNGAAGQVPSGGLPPGRLQTVFLNSFTKTFAQNSVTAIGRRGAGGAVPGGAPLGIGHEMDLFNGWSSFQPFVPFVADGRGGYRPAADPNDSSLQGLMPQSGGPFGMDCMLCALGSAPYDAAVKLLSNARNGVFFQDQTGGLTGEAGLYAGPDKPAGGRTDGAVVHSWQHRGLFLNLNPDGGDSVFQVDAAGHLFAGGGISFAGGDNAPGSLFTDRNWGGLLRGRAGAVGDLGFQTAAGLVAVQVAGDGTIGVSAAGPGANRSSLPLAFHAASPAGTGTVALLSATATGDLSISTPTGVTRPSAFAIPTGTPASAAAPCAQGQLMQDASYLYSCVATNTWKRAALGSW